jgi:hypothetical protein
MANPTAAEVAGHGFAVKRPFDKDDAEREREAQCLHWRSQKTGQHYARKAALSGLSGRLLSGHDDCRMS